MIGLASCQDVAEQPAPRDTEAAQPGYPSLHTVPPRPQLSYTVEQRRAVVDGLIADRENARYSSEVVRYRAGLSSLPPPAAPSLAAVPLEPPSDAPDAADASAPPAPARDAPVVDPETEFLYEDDDLESFMEEMRDERSGAPGATGGEPEANAVPLGTRMIRASALRPIPPADAYAGRPPVVTLAMPPKAASLPVPAPVETVLAGRAPGVVWGMPDMTMLPAEPDPPALAAPSPGPQHAALPPPSASVEMTMAGRAPGVVWGMPDLAPAPAEPPPAVAGMPAQRSRRASPPAPAAIETVLAGRAPGVIWGMPDMAPAPATAALAAAPAEDAVGIRAARAAPFPTPAKPGRAAPGETVLADAGADPAPRAAEPSRAVPPAPVKPAPPAPTHTVLAGPASEPVRATRTAIAEWPADPPAEALARADHAAAATGAAPPPAPPRPAHDGAGVVLATAASVRPPMRQLLPMPQADTTTIEVGRGVVGIEAASGWHRGAAVGSVAFHPRSAILASDAVARLGRLLAKTAPEARIKIVGEADAPALALDRALAVGLALVQGGMPADRLELTLAHGGSGDQARLFLAAPEL